VMASYEFDPYGNPVDNSGGDPYGYTGEWYEGYLKLLHLRARWYAHETGTFLSVDPVESEPPYQYVRGNPVNLTDPSGLQGGPFDPYSPKCYEPIRPGDVRPLGCTLPPKCYEPLREGDIYPIECPLPSQDDRDLTSWLSRELKAGIDNQDINFIKDLFTGTSGTPYLYRLGMAGTYWRALVRNNARYDFKHKILDQLGPTILFKGDSNATLLWSEYSVPGNIFFGYVGSYVGFQGPVTHIGAGYAQAVDQIKKIRNICDIPHYLPPSTIWYLGDNPTDYRGVQFGIDLWKRYGKSLTIYTLRRELEQNHHKFTPPPSIPTSPRKNLVKKWPYEVGDFSGYDEHKHWPPRPENGFGFYEP